MPGLRAGKVVVIGTDDGIAGIGDAAARTRRGRHHTDPVRTQFVSTGASIGVVLLLLTLAGWLLGLSGVGIPALAGVTYISSSGVIARLLSDLRRLGNRETPAVLSILVLEDFAMAAYLPLLAVLAAGAPAENRCLPAEICATMRGHPVVSAMWRRCLMTTSITAWSNVP